MGQAALLHLVAVAFGVCGLQGHLQGRGGQRRYSGS